MSSCSFLAAQNLTKFRAIGRGILAVRAHRFVRLFPRFHHRLADDQPIIHLARGGLVDPLHGEARIVVGGNSSVALLAAHTHNSFSCSLCTSAQRQRYAQYAGGNKGQERCNERTANRGGNRKDPAYNIRPSNQLKIIRFTNTGAFVDRCEYTDALDEDLLFDAPEHPGFEVRPGTEGLPKLILLYVHGWRHNGNSEDPNLKSFDKLVNRIRDVQGAKKNIIGIYIRGMPRFLSL